MRSEARQLSQASQIINTTPAAIHNSSNLSITATICTLSQHLYFHKCTRLISVLFVIIPSLHFLPITPSLILLYYFVLLLLLSLSSPPLKPPHPHLSSSPLLPFHLALSSLRTLEARSCCWVSICCCCLAAISCSSASVMSIRGVATWAGRNNKGGQGQKKTQSILCCNRCFTDIYSRSRTRQQVQPWSHKSKSSKRQTRGEISGAM